MPKRKKLICSRKMSGRSKKQKERRHQSKGHSFQHLVKYLFQDFSRTSFRLTHPLRLGNVDKDMLLIPLIGSFRTLYFPLQFLPSTVNVERCRRKENRCDTFISCFIFNFFFIYHLKRMSRFMVLLCFPIVGGGNFYWKHLWRCCSINILHDHYHHSPNEDDPIAVATNVTCDSLFSTRTSLEESSDTVLYSFRIGARRRESPESS